MKSICIFVKAPVAGRVKTRLMPRISAETCAQLSRAMAEDTFAVASLVPDARVWIAYEPAPALPDPAWLSGSEDWFAQRGVDLGERLVHAMQRIFESSGGPLIIIGSDLPSLTASLLDKAFSLLEAAPAVLGPTVDGGYYLIGLREPRPELFGGIPWSTPRVFAATEARAAAAGVSFRRLPTRRDLDAAHDLDAYLTDESLAPEFQATAAVLQRLSASAR